MIFTNLLIGPYFFEDEEGNALTVNGGYYRTMITQFFMPLEDIALHDISFQQDGARCHAARKTLTVLRRFTPGRVIPQFDDPSCDLTPLDFWLWGYLQSQVYVNKSATTEALKAEIRRSINEIRPHIHIYRVGIKYGTKQITLKRRGLC